MATRAHNQQDNALIRTYTVATAAAVKGTPCKFGASDDTMTSAAAGEQAHGIYLDDGAIGAVVRVAMLAGASIIPVKVGTAGTATRGGYAEVGTAGFTNRTIGGGSVARHISGIFTQSGVAGDFVGLIPLALPAVSA